MPEDAPLGGKRRRTIFSEKLSIPISYFSPFDAGCSVINGVWVSGVRMLMLIRPVINFLLLPSFFPGANRRNRVRYRRQAGKGIRDTRFWATAPVYTRRNAKILTVVILILPRLDVSREVYSFWIFDWRIPSQVWTVLIGNLNIWFSHSRHPLKRYCRRL